MNFKFNIISVISRSNIDLYLSIKCLRQVAQRQVATKAYLLNFENKNKIKTKKEKKVREYIIV